MGKDYEIARASGACRACGRELAGGQEFVAVLHDRGETFEREDLCPECWQGREGGDSSAFSVWRSRVPRPEEPKRQFVSNEVLIEFFERLEGEDAPAKVNFRFVLALMLMRKKLLVYDASEVDEAGRDIWTMHVKADSRPIRVIHPELDEQQMAEVTAQLGAVFETST
ncbi:MAG TPA: hypothetical protein VFJ30_08715 [Phycisphaerae bacterium]|nr:hypothetical protein [Phycisphaerae bacterium]